MTSETEVAVSEKECSGCNRVLPASCFFRHRDRATGLQSRCKECARQWERERRNSRQARGPRTDWKKRSDRKSARDRQKREQKDPQFLAIHREAERRYASKPENRAKIKARAKLKHLVRTGKIARGACEVCGKPNAEAHHHDYSKPLDVQWLCRNCHVRVHQLEAAE